MPFNASIMSFLLAFLTSAAFFQLQAARPVSVIFILDNSGSMDENDPTGTRFSAIGNLLDNLAMQSPESEAGLVVFTRRLTFDHRENAFFQTAFPGDTTQHDSFVPLTKLNAKLAEGRTGLDTLKAILKDDDKGNLLYTTKLPASRNNSGMGRANTRDGTDISLGFTAAKLAMASAKSSRADRFFIFLSDGTPSTPDNGREQFINEFVTGEATPTTFTIFFDTQNSPPKAPNSIVQMTNNIKANGYSDANPKSTLWSVALPSESLYFILIETMLNPGFTSIRNAREAFRTLDKAAGPKALEGYDAAGKFRIVPKGTAGQEYQTGILLQPGR